MSRCGLLAEVLRTSSFELNDGRHLEGDPISSWGKQDVDAAAYAVFYEEVANEDPLESKAGGNIARTALGSLRASG